MKEKGWLEAEFAADKVAITWVLSAGSNKALEYLNGSSVDFGSSAGVGGAPRQDQRQPDQGGLHLLESRNGRRWSCANDSPITKVRRAQGQAGRGDPRGTDPGIFLLRALARCRAEAPATSRS